MTYLPILNYITPSGSDKEVFSDEFFNAATGDHGTNRTYPAKFDRVVNKQVAYFSGAQLSGGTGSAPSIITQPVSMSIFTGSYGSVFSVIATSPGGGSETNYAWYKNGVAYTSGTSVMYNNSTSTLATVLVPSTSGDSGSTWYCVVSNPYGSVQTITVTLTVSGTVAAPMLAINLPSTKNVADGGPTTFLIEATGTATLVFDWYRNASLVWTDPAPVDGGAPYHVFSSTYTTPTITSGDNGASYHCVVTNAYGTATTNSCTITVGTAPTITSGTVAAVTTTEGTPFTVAMTATGSATLGYHWYSSAVAMTLNEILLNTYPHTLIGSSASLTYTPLIGFNGSYITGVVNNNYGYAGTNSALVTVTAGTVTVPTVYSSPGNQTDPATPFTLIAVFQGGSLSYLWEYKTVSSSTWVDWGSTGIETVLSTPTRYSNSLTYDYSYSGTAWLNGTQVRCTATNSAGSATTTPCTLIFGTPPATVTSVTISPTSYTFQGWPDYTQFTATAHWSDATTTDCTLAGTWTAADPTKIVISNGSPNPGRAVSQAVPAGSTTVSCTYGSQIGSATCTLTGSILSTIAITPANTSVAIASNVVYVATGTYNNAATSVLTEEVIWTSSNSAIATIGAPYGAIGYPTAHGISAGAITITASTTDFFSPITGTTGLTVTSGGGGGGSTLYYRPTTGTGSSAFSGAIDTTSVTVDSSTYSMKLQNTTGTSTYLFTGFGTGTVTGTLNVRANTVISDDSGLGNAFISADYSTDNGSSYTKLFYASFGADVSSATPSVSATLTSINLANLIFRLSLTGYRVSDGMGGWIVDYSKISLFDVVFLS